MTDQTVDAQGRAAALPSWFSGCLHQPPSTGQSGDKVKVAASHRSLGACLGRLTDEGYRQRLVYQPHTHFWPLQWAETGVYLTASALLAGLSVWWTRRRLS